MSGSATSTLAERDGYCRRPPWSWSPPACSLRAPCPSPECPRSWRTPVGRVLRRQRALLPPRGRLLRAGPRGVAGAALLVVGGRGAVLPVLAGLALPRRDRPRAAQAAGAVDPRLRDVVAVAALVGRPHGTVSGRVLFLVGHPRLGARDRRDARDHGAPSASHSPAGPPSPDHARDWQGSRSPLSCTTSTPRFQVSARCCPSWVRRRCWPVERQVRSASEGCLPGDRCSTWETSRTRCTSGTGR